MTNQNNPQNDPLDAEFDGKLDGALRKIARETHPRPAFVAKLRGELENQAAHPRRDFWSLLRGARPWLAQAVLIAALVGLVLIGGTMTSRLFAPDGGEPREVGSSLPTSAVGDSSDALPVGAMARLGRGKIQSIDAAPDGRIAVGSTAGLCVYNTGLSTDWCRWTDALVHEVLFDPTGTRLAVSSADNRVEIWDSAQGQVIASREFTLSVSYTSPNLPNPNFFTVNGIAWEPEGSRIAVSETGLGVSAWDWQNDSIAWGPVAVGGEPIGVEWITGPEGESILAALTPENLTLVDGSTGQAMSTLSGMAGAAPGSFLTLDRASQGSRIAVGSDDKISVFDLAAWNVNTYQSIPHPAGRYYGIALSTDGDHVAALTNDAQIITFDLRNGQEMARLRAMPLSPMVWNAADGRLYYASPDGSLAYYDGSSENVIASGHTLAPQVIAWRDDGTVVTAANNFTYTWDSSTQALASFSEMTLTDSVMAAGLSKDGTRALFFDSSASDVVNAARIIVWDVVNNQPLHDIEVSGFVHAVTLSPDGTRVAAVHGSGQIFTWNLLDNGAEQRDMTGISGFTSVDALSFHPYANHVAVAFTREDGTTALELYDADGQLNIGDLPVDQNQTITELAWTEDWHYLGASQGSQTVIWETSQWNRTAQSTPTLTDGTQYLRAFTFNKGLGFASAEREVIYYPSNGESPRVFSGHVMGVTDLAFRPDGGALASASNDGTVILWDLGSASLPPEENRPTETPLPVDVPTLTVTPTPGYTEYTVAAGDTCGGIAFGFGISVDSLIALNNLPPSCDNLYVGQVLRVPYPTPTPLANFIDPTTPAFLEYTVITGDTCAGIAFSFNVSVESLIAANNLAADCSNLAVGQILIIPYPTPTPTPSPTYTLDPNPGSTRPTETPSLPPTTMPGEPTPLPNATQRPIPNTTGYDVSELGGISPSGKWGWMAIRGEWTENAPRKEDLNFILVDSVDGPENWVLEEYTPHGLGEGRPTGFTFSADDRYLFFYDSGQPDGCGQPWQANLRRLDLDTGDLEPVPPIGHTQYGEFAFSPDAYYLAVVTQSHIEVYDMSSLQPSEMIPLKFSKPEEWSTAEIYWQPGSPSSMLAFEIVSPPENPCTTQPLEQQRQTIVSWAGDVVPGSGNAWSFDSPPGKILTGWGDKSEAQPFGFLIYREQDGSEITVNPRTGEVITD